MRTILFEAAIASLATLTLAVNPLVNVTYRSYQGTAQSNGITQWLGMQYADPPTGNLRFQAPQPPTTKSGVNHANAWGPICLSTPTGTVDATHSEDCLYLNVWAPSSATSSSKLPVYVFIQSGGFNLNSNPYFNGSDLVQQSGNKLVVVNFNYRVGVYGFLAGKEIQAGGSLNNGLKDQRAVLQWVQKHIGNFGGDPGHVTLGGASAGAQSVTLHLTAYGGRNDNLFHATAAESQGMSSLRTVAESQFMYDSLVQRANCGSANSTLACLQALSAASLQEINTIQPFPGASGNPLYMYGPTLDYDFITDYTYNAFAQGNFLQLPAIYGDDTNEGTHFAPKTPSSVSAVNTFLQNNFPNLTSTQLSKINSLYPLNGTVYYPIKSYPSWTTYGQYAAWIYGELRYVCPGLFLSSTYANKSLSTWNYRWNVIDPADNSSGTGVAHTVEVTAIWGPSYTNGSAPASYYSGQVNNPMVAYVQSYWTSFIQTYNPNTNKLGVEWNQWSPSDKNTRLRFQHDENGMESVPQEQLNRCEYLWGIGVGLGQ
jgi:carboxylesterase type B